MGFDVTRPIKHPTDDLPKVEPGYYQHYKGGSYKVVMMARHSETLEWMVVYRSIRFKSYWTRPLSEWHKPVNGQKDEARFRRLRFWESIFARIISF